MEKRYSRREAVQKALEQALRYERLGYCRRCEDVHHEPRHLDSINLIAEEVYLWLGFGREKQDLRFFSHVLKVLEDAPVTGRREADIPLLTDLLMADMGMGGR